MRNFLKKKIGFDFEEDGDIVTNLKNLKYILSKNNW